MSPVIQSFAPIIQHDATRLILGSMPGQASLDAHQYYAHPRNAFWPIIEQLFSDSKKLDYPARCALLQQHQIGLWDVLQACIRPGSLDSKIINTSIIPNDFVQLFKHHPHIQNIYFNGAKAEQLYLKHVLPLLKNNNIKIQRLPSTSPAHAALSFDKKFQQWQFALK